MEKSVTKYRKTALIEAVPTTEGLNGEVLIKEPPAWLTQALLDKILFMDAPYRDGGATKYLTIKTLEGNMRVSPGDWIARGVKGELWPIKADVFEASYEEVVE
jgi:hypothetical protein